MLIFRDFIQHAVSVVIVFMLVFTATTADCQQQPVDNWNSQGLSEKAIELPSIGFSIHFPLNSRVTKQPQSSRRIMVQSNDSTWIATVDVDITTNSDLTIKEVAVNTINKINKTYPVTSQIVITEPMIDKHDSRQIEVTVKLPSNVEEYRLYTIMNPSPQNFLVYTMWCSKENSADVKKLYDDSVKSIRFSDPEDILNQRLTAIDATENVISKINPLTYSSLLISQRWFRIYRKIKESADEQEIGYYRVEESMAPRGRLTPDRPPSNYSVLEREEGLLVSLIARYVQPDGSIYDVESTAWSSRDRKSEVWSIRAAMYPRLQDGTYVSPSRSAMTGNRSGNRIDVSLEIPSAPLRNFSIQVPTKAYITQAERYLLYRLLKPWSEVTYGMYYFDPTLSKLIYRVDKIQAGDTQGQYHSEQKLNQDSLPNNVILDASGVIQRIDSSSGEITEPTSLEQIRKLWNSAGLPTTSMSKLVKQKTPGTNRRPGN